MALKEIRTYVASAKEMGRGVFANVNIKKRVIVEISPCLRFDKYDNDIIQDTVLRFYVFSGETKRINVLALGIGSLFNHSKTPNVKYEYDVKRNVMVFTAKRKIHRGEQLFIDYGYDPVQQQKSWEIQKLKERSEKLELGNLENKKFDGEVADVPVLPVGNSNQLPGGPVRPADYQLVDCRDCMRGCDDCRSYCKEFGIVPEEHPEPKEKEEQEPSLLKRILGFLEGLVGGH